MGYFFIFQSQYTKTIGMIEGGVSRLVAVVVAATATGAGAVAAIIAAAASGPSAAVVAPAGLS
jgi:hypothetical protein